MKNFIKTGKHKVPTQNIFMVAEAGDSILIFYRDNTKIQIRIPDKIQHKKTFNKLVKIFFTKKI